MYFLDFDASYMTDADNKAIAYHAVECFNKNFDPATGYNVALTSIPELQKLWDGFLAVTKHHFGPLDIIDNGRVGSFWSYVQNKERYSSVWHTHITTASINAVYYPSVPDSTGTLSIINNNGEVDEITIKEKVLYLFPGWMLHKPNKQLNSMTPRVSINMELLTRNRPALILDNREILW